MVKGMKQTEIGMIPEDWEVIRLGDYSTLKNGYAFPSIDFSDKGPIVMTPGNFKLGGGLKFNGDKLIRFKGQFSKNMQFKNGDLVMVMTDLTPDCNLLGKAGIIDTDEVVLHNQRIGKVECSKHIHSEYLCYYFNSEPFSARMKNTATGSTVRHTSTPTIKNTILPLPPLPEQEAIAGALSDADAWIESLEQLIAKKRLIKQGAMQELLTPKEGWEVKKFEQVFLKVPSKKYQINSNEYFQVGRYPIVDQGQQKIVGYSDREDKVFFPGNIIVFGDHTRIIKYVNYPFIVGADGVQLLSSLNENIQFLYYLLSDYEIPNTGYNRHFKYLKDFDYHIPSLPEQTRIATILSDMELELEALEQQLRKARQIKQGMMQELLTGKIRLEL